MQPAGHSNLSACSATFEDLQPRWTGPVAFFVTLLLATSPLTGCSTRSQQGQLLCLLSSDARDAGK